MNATHLDAHLKYLSPNGVTLNPSEQINIKLALDQLQALSGFEQLDLWGKIEGKLYFSAVSIPNFLQGVSLTTSWR
jgi:hypothetical protein